MITIYGKYTNAIVYTVENELYALEDYARKQLQMICNHPSSEGSYKSYAGCASGKGRNHRPHNDSG